MAQEGFRSGESRGWGWQSGYRDIISRKALEMVGGVRWR